MKDINEIKVTNPVVVRTLSNTDKIKQQTFFLKAVGNTYLVVNQNNEIVCETLNRSYALSFTKHPELIQFTEMLRDNLKGLKAEGGMIFQMVDDLLTEMG